MVGLNYDIGYVHTFRSMKEMTKNFEKQIPEKSVPSSIVALLLLSGLSGANASSASGSY